MAIFLGTMIISVPIVFSMLGSSIAFVMTNPIDLIVIPQKLVAGINSFVLLAVPFFLLVGQLMGYTGVTQRLVNFASSIVGNIRGGLAHVNILTSMLMAGIQGSCVADSAAIGSMLIPSMVKDGYKPSFAAAVTSTSSAVGPIIPPSIIMVVYGSLGNVSVGKLFLAGAIPGAILGIYLMIVSYIVSKKEGYGKSGKKASLSEIVRTFKKAALALIVPIIILGGIVGGVFTPTESGVVALFYLLFISALRLGGLRLTFKGFVKGFRDTIELIGAVMFIIGAANLFGWVLNLVKAADLLGSLLVSISTNPVAILLMINVLLLVLGCFIDTTALLIILTGLLVPLVTSFGIDPVHFGIIMVINLTIGLNTPPVGISMYISCGIAGVSIEEWIRAAWLLLIAMFVTLLLITIFPWFSLWLPNLLMP
jgi:C4-dicarboxylate transporter DctM subunit